MHFPALWSNKFPNLSPGLTEIIINLKLTKLISPSFCWLNVGMSVLLLFLVSILLLQTMLFLMWVCWLSKQYQKITRMWRRWWGTPKNICLAFIDKLEKQLFVTKNCWSGPIKSVRVLTFTMLYLKKIEKKTWRYHYFTPAYQKSWWYDLLFLRYRVWQTEIGNYGSFTLLPPPL